MFKLYYPHKNAAGQSGMNPLLWDSGKRKGEVRLFPSREAAGKFALLNNWPKFLIIAA